MLLKYNFIFLSLFFLSILDSNILAQEESPSLVVSETARLTLDAIQGKEEYFKTNSEELYTLINKILLPNFDRNYAA